MSRSVWTPVHSETLKQCLSNPHYTVFPIEIIGMIDSYIPFQLLKPVASNCDFLSWYDKPTIYYIFMLLDSFCLCLINNSNAHLIIFRLYDLSEISRFGSDIINIIVLIIGFIIAFILKIAHITDYTSNIIFVSIISSLSLLFLCKRLCTKYSKLIIDTEMNKCISNKDTLFFKDCHCLCQCCNCNRNCNCKCGLCDNKSNIEIFEIDQRCKLTFERGSIDLHFRSSGRGWKKILKFQREIVPFKGKQSRSIKHMNDILHEWITINKLK